MSAQADTLSKSDLERICGLIYQESGININAEKKIMLEGRLKRRMNALKLETYGDYCKYVFSPTRDPEEVTQLIDAVSTNKTDFFREKEHFDVLVAKVLPALTEGYLVRRSTRSCALSADSLLQTIVSPIGKLARDMGRGGHMSRACFPSYQPHSSVVVAAAAARDHVSGEVLDA